ncbi:MAG: sensor histidine kinase [Acidimicrobiales bacterium]
MPALPPTVASAAYHIATEALTNAYRHSGGTGAHIHVGVTADGSRLTVEVADNGRGIDDTVNAGVGLASMRARAAAVGGSLSLNSRPGGGTAVRAELPIMVGNAQ